VSRLGKRSSTEKSEKTRRCSGRCDRRRRRTSAIPAASIAWSSCRGCAARASRRPPPARPAWPHATTTACSCSRYIDTADHTDAEFRAWLTGIATLLPRRRQAETVGQFRRRARRVL